MKHVLTKLIKLVVVDSSTYVNFNMIYNGKNCTKKMKSWGEDEAYAHSNWTLVIWKVSD